MRAVLVFCEGKHDVAFVTRSLGALAGAHWVDRPVGKLPAPLGTKPNPKNPKQAVSRSVIAMRYEDRPIDDLKLSGAAHAPVPTFDRVVEVSPDRTLYVMMRCGGDRAARPVLELLEDLRAVMTVASDLDALALAFMFDADGAGVGARELAFSRDYAACVDSEHGEPLRHGQWGRGRHGPVGLFVFHDPDTLAGTLEDVLAPLVREQWPRKWSAAGTYLDEHVEPNDRILRGPADRQKAQIGVTGSSSSLADP